MHFCSLIIRKSTVVEKYNGGVEQFRKDYSIGISDVNQEDDELFSLGKMNVEDFDIDRLMKSGISFDESNQYSDDFTILHRYGDFAWKTEWITHNKLFAWDVKTSPECILKVDEFSKTTMDVINQMSDAGENPWAAIRK